MCLVFTYDLVLHMSLICLPEDLTGLVLYFGIPSKYFCIIYVPPYVWWNLIPSCLCPIPILMMYTYSVLTQHSILWITVKLFAIHFTYGFSIGNWLSYITPVSLLYIALSTNNFCIKFFHSVPCHIWYICLCHLILVLLFIAYFFWCWWFQPIIYHNSPRYFSLYHFTILAWGVHK